MTPMLSGIRSTVLAFLAAFLIAGGAVAQEDHKPLLSDEIRAALESGGPESAKTRFDELFPDRADLYQMDLSGVHALAAERIMAGDMEAVRVLVEMVTAMNQAMVESVMPGAATATSSRQQEGERAEREGTERKVVTGPGPARTDLRRFRGQYGKPGQDPPRNLFAIESCDGYLVAGPMWADVSNWNLTSVAENTFTYTDSFQSLRLTFEVGADEAPLSVSHTLDAIPSPLPYLGPLPVEWGDKCLTVRRGR